MAVDPNFRRERDPERLCYACFDKARELGANNVILYSNTLQAAAIKLYENSAFSTCRLKTMFTRELM
jgi:ribosomal protein S18 acetylase RimI-like enzyme